MEINNIARQCGHFTLLRRTDIAFRVNPVEMVPHGNLRIAGEHPAEGAGPAQQCAGVHSQQTVVIDEKTGLQQFHFEAAAVDQFNPGVSCAFFNRFLSHAAGQKKDRSCGGKNNLRDFHSLYSYANA